MPPVTSRSSSRPSPKLLTFPEATDEASQPPGVAALSPEITLFRRDDDADDGRFGERSSVACGLSSVDKPNLPEDAAAVSHPSPPECLLLFPFSRAAAAAPCAL